jgi:hypothetical protein
MGEEAGDDVTLDSIRQIVAARSGAAEGRQARTADDLANLLDRAGDLTREELEMRIASVEGGVRGDPLGELLTTHRIVAVPFAGRAEPQWRFILTESYGRYASAFGDEAMSRVRASSTDGRLMEVEASEIIPEPLRRPVITQAAARREILARFLALSGPTTIAEIKERYGWDRQWIESRLTEWQRTGKLVAGRFRLEVLEPEWCSRRVAELARRRALAHFESRSKQSSCRCSRKWFSGGSTSIREISWKARAESRQRCASSMEWLGRQQDGSAII